MLPHTSRPVVSGGEGEFVATQMYRFIVDNQKIIRIFAAPILGS